jgi:hypothetical protein
MENISKPTTSLTNSNKVVQYETFDTLTTTFDTETRTFDEMATTWTNQVLSGVGFLWSIKRFPWTETSPWLTEGGITNQAKP